MQVTLGNDTVRFAYQASFSLEDDCIALAGHELFIRIKGTVADIIKQFEEIERVPVGYRYKMHVSFHVLRTAERKYFISEQEHGQTYLLNMASVTKVLRELRAKDKPFKPAMEQISTEFLAQLALISNVPQKPPAPLF